MSRNLDEIITNAWYNSAKWLYLLWPLSLIFAVIVELRRLCFKYHFFSVYRSPLPVVIVGNIALGGTGKSPLVCYLVEALRKQGYRPGIVSRGYGAKLDKNEVREVFRDSMASDVGDEPLMLKRRLDCPVFVSPNRVLAVQFLEKMACDIVISDDGLQHYALDRDIEICVFDGARKWGNGHLLPMGPLREPIHRIHELDFVVLNGTTNQDNTENLAVAINMDLQLQQAINLQDGQTRALHEFVSSPVHAVAGIGNPERFFRTLEQADLEVCRHAFPDHYAYQQDDFDFSSALPILMTEKDAVKCQTFALNDAWYVPVQANLNADLTAMIINKLTQQRRL